MDAVHFVCLAENKLLVVHRVLYNFPIDYYSHLIQATTQRTNFGPCTTTFDGTSAACPVASGTIALALEAK